MKKGKTGTPANTNDMNSVMMREKNIRDKVEKGINEGRCIDRKRHRQNERGRRKQEERQREIDMYSGIESFTQTK